MFSLLKNSCALHSPACTNRCGWRHRVLPCVRNKWEPCQNLICSPNMTTNRELEELRRQLLCLSVYLSSPSLSCSCALCLDLLSLPSPCSQSLPTWHCPYHTFQLWKTLHGESSKKAYLCEGKLAGKRVRHYKRQLKKERWKKRECMTRIRRARDKRICQRDRSVCMCVREERRGENDSTKRENKREVGRDSKVSPKRAIWKR